MIGSYAECSNSVNILTREYCQATGSNPNISNCTECKRKDEIINQLQITIKNLSEKMKLYKEGSDNYEILKRTFENISTNKEAPNKSLQSYEPIILDMRYPLIKVRKCQLDYLKSIKKATMATRAIIDILFDEDQLKGMNASKLKDVYPEKFEVILNYIIGKFNIERPKIIKIITNKCLSK